MINRFKWIRNVLNIEDKVKLIYIPNDEKLVNTGTGK